MKIKKSWQILPTLAFVIFLIVIISPWASSQVENSWESNLEETTEIFTVQATSQSEAESTPEIPEKQESIGETIEEASSQEDAPVVLDGETLYTYSSEIEGIPPEYRAERTSKAIEQVAKDFLIPIDSLKIIKVQGVRVISTEEDVVIILAEADARAANRSLDELANEYLQKVTEAISQYREKRSLRNLVLRILFVLMESVIFVVLLILLNKIFAKIYRQIDIWRTTLFPRFRIQNLQLLSSEQKYKLSLRLAKLIYLVLVAILVFSYLPLLALHIPQARGVRAKILSQVYAALTTAWNAIISYLPNLLIIIIAGVITYYIIRFCQFFFNAIDRERLSFSGFDRDWAKPTLKVIVLLILAVALAVIFPYLPGAGAPAFQGVSILIGALITLGGAGAVSNLIGGVIIIYTRAFRIGDIIQTSSFKGVVHEKTILSTRILTLDNEMITIPNAILVASSIVNYNTALRELNKPIVVHTSITLGYDVPWRKVERVLVEAACSTSGILEKPVPFVQPTSLDDFYVSYKLRAYTKDMSNLKDIYKELHYNILDKCNEAEIEILSPHYSAVRDGNQNTIPENYLPKDYTAPGFRVHPLDKLFNQPINTDND